MLIVAGRDLFALNRGFKRTKRSRPTLEVAASSKSLRDNINKVVIFLSFLFKQLKLHVLALCKRSCFAYDFPTYAHYEAPLVHPQLVGTTTSSGRACNKGISNPI